MGKFASIAGIILGGVVSSAVSSFFGKKLKLPALPPLPPTPEDPEVKRRVETERLARRRRKGLAATTLTKPGLGDVPALTDRARLTTTLGGGRVAK